MRIVITGVNGLVGQKLSERLVSSGHLVGGIDIQPSAFLSLPIQYQALNITSRKSTVDSIKVFRPEIIIHCAAMTAVDACETERELCWKVNVDGTENVCIGAERTNARVIYISTDYVFDGENGPYSETDNPNPSGYYAKSKLAGENVVRGAGEFNTVIRSIVIYGYGKNIKSSFITWLLGELRAGRKVRIVNDQWGNSTIAEDLAEGIDKLIDSGKSGIYHMGGATFVNRYEMAIATARFFNLDETLISPISTEELKQPAKRPLRSGLITAKAEAELSCQFRTIEASLAIYKSCEEQS